MTTLMLAAGPDEASGGSGPQDAQIADGWRLLFERHPSPMWIFDVETLAILDVNEAAVRHYGYSREEFLRLTIRDMRPPEDVPRLEAYLNRPRRAAIAAHGVWRHRKKDGTAIMVEISSSVLRYRGRPAELVVVHDVTHHVRLEEELSASEETCPRLFEEGLTGDFVSTVDGRLLACNENFARLLGFASVEEALACNVETFYEDPADRKRVLERLRRDGRVDELRLVVRRRDGRRIHVVERAVGTFDAAGRLIGLRA